MRSAAVLLALFASPVLAGLSAVVAALGFYRALMFIHELTHIHRDALPGFRTGWNLLVGIPMLTPSFMYEGVHTLHHARTRYGTAEDPEYLPLALMKPWSLPVFALSALLLPMAGNCAQPETRRKRPAVATPRVMLFIVDCPDWSSC